MYGVVGKIAMYGEIDLRHASLGCNRDIIDLHTEHTNETLRDTLRRDTYTTGIFSRCKVRELYILLFLSLP